MHRMAVIFALLVAAAGCAGRTGTFVPSGGQLFSGGANAAPVDVGRRPSRARVSAVVMLRYNHQAELERFVNHLALSHAAHPLTHAQFVARYAATPQQQQRALAVLRRAGFSIQRISSNRTLVDVSAPTAAFERFFSTRIHNFRQPHYGVRYAPVAPVRIPAELRSLVFAVDADTRVLAHPDLTSVRTGAVTPGVTSNVLLNPGFESGKLKPWTSCRSGNGLPPAVVTNIHPHGGHFDAYAGSRTGKPEPNGITSVCQAVTIPNKAQLQVYVWGVTNDRALNVYEFGALYDAATGKLVNVLYKNHHNDRKWSKRTFNLSAYSGQNDYVAFGVAGQKSHAGRTVGQFIDDASLIGATGCSTPKNRLSPANAVTPTPNAAPNGGWGPGAIANALDMPSNYGYTGGGQTVAIVIDATVASSDLATYLQQFCIVQTGTVTYVPVDGGGNVAQSQPEAALDLETIAGLAPDADIRVYNTPDLSNQSVLDAYNQVLTDNLATVVNSSFSGCDTQTPTYDMMSNQLAVQGVATGVTFAASSGDQGSDCFSAGVFPAGVGAPASDPYFIAVGGNEANPPVAPNYCPNDVPSVITNPAVWNNCAGSGGGGVSTMWTPAPWQQPIAGVVQTGRNVPDIALPATYDGIVVGGQWSMNSGTSWSSPMFVAMQAEINQACAKSYWAVHTIYGAFNATGYTHFVDVTSGNNLWTKSLYTLSYSAAPGFDQVSGVGIPLGINLGIDECGLTIPALRQAGPTERAVMPAGEPGSLGRTVHP
jgi:subtilase family serine protease